MQSKRRETLRGLVWTTLQKCHGCKQTAERVQKISNFSWVDLRNSPELTTLVILCKEMQAWQTSGAWMMVIPSVTWSWCRPTFTSFEVGAERNPKKKKRSSTTSKTWTQSRLNDQLTRCESWPPSPRWLLEAPRSESLWDPLLAKSGVIRAMYAVPGSSDGICAPL